MQQLSKPHEQRHAAPAYAAVDYTLGAITLLIGVGFFVTCFFSWLTLTYPRYPAEPALMRPSAWDLALAHNSIAMVMLCIPLAITITSLLFFRHFSGRGGFVLAGLGCLGLILIYLLTLDFLDDASPTLVYPLANHMAMGATLAAILIGVCAIIIAANRPDS